MTACVEKHVREGGPYFTRRAQHVEVIAVREYRSAAAKRSVQRPCDAGAHGVHPARERPGIGRLYHEMCVCVLERVMNEAKVPAVADRREAVLEGADDGHGTQGRKAREKFHGHVGGKAGGYAFARAMRDRRVRPALPAGAGSAAAPFAVFAQG